MDKKKILAIWAATILMTITLTSTVVADGPGNTDVYVIPGASDIEIEDTSYIRLICNTTQRISGWGFQYLNFTQGVINVSKIRTDYYSPSSSDYYMFQDNSTMQGRGTINNTTGVIGGSLVNYYWSVIIDGGGWINNTNRTILNMTIQGRSCGTANITIYSYGNQCFDYSGIPLDFTYHTNLVTIHPAKPTSFTATAYKGSQINLSWVKGNGSIGTIIRGKLGSLPTDVTDGTWGVNTTFLSANHIGLTPAEHWYYRTWSWNETKKLRSLTYADSDAITISTVDYYVDDDNTAGPWDGSMEHPYQYIQEGINAANPGYTVFVYNGTYEEQINVTKSVVLEGQNKTSTIVVGGFNVTEDNTTIQSFNITGGYEWDPDGAGLNGVCRAGIYSPSSNNIFFNNNFWDIIGGNGVDSPNAYDLCGSGGTGLGIYLLSSENNSMISNNFINIFGGNGGRGMFIDGDGGNGVGISLNSSSSNTIFGDIIWNITGGNGGSGDDYGGSGGEGFGIKLQSSTVNNISFEFISNLVGGTGGFGYKTNGTDGIGAGIHYMDSTNNTLASCTLINGNYGIFLNSSSENLCYNSYFSNNSINAYDNGNNTWNITKTPGTNIIGGPYLGGNYWSNYSGTDNNHDGIGDTPYNISGGSNQDLYPLMHQLTSPPTFVWVDDNFNSSTPGWGYDHFDVIQDGIDVVSEHGTVFVYNGTYSHTIVNKTITILGESRIGTAIGSGNATPYPYSEIVEITADSVNMSKLTINAMYWQLPYGLSIDSNNNIISDITINGGNHHLLCQYGLSLNGINNKITNNSIEAFYSSLTVDGSYNNISNNSLGASFSGIPINGDNNTIAHNSINGQYGVGIQLLSSNNNTIKKNSINVEDNTAIYLSDSDGNILDENYVHSELNTGNIIVLSNSNQNLIVHNDMSIPFGGGFTTIQLSLSNNNIIRENNITVNRPTNGINITSNSSNNHIYHNNFFFIINMSFYDECINFWDNGYPSGGNYWNRYAGNDIYHGPNQDIPGSDGIGDTPYNISGGSNQDLYPLMEPNGWLNEPLVANFTYTINDRTLHVNGSSSYAYDSNITTYNLSFGDGTNATGKIVSHTYLHYGTYNVTLTVTDDDGNYIALTKQIPVIDFIFPQIIDHTPSTGYTGNSFTFNATITDNDQVVTAKVEYWYGTGAHTNVNMTNVAGDYWVNTITMMDTLDSLNYFLAAADPANNWNTTIVKNIILVDDDNPSFVDNSPPTGTTGDSYIFDIAASDNIGVASVTVNWTHGQYSHINVPLNYDGGSIWSLTINLDNNLSAMTYKIKVRDTSNNMITEPQMTVSVTDNDKPVIVDHTSSVAHVSYPFTFNATITDNILVSGVWVEYWFDSNAHVNTSMIKIGVDQWEKTISVNLTSITLRYIISAVDSSGNWKNTGIIIVPIDPDYPPSTPQKPSGPASGYADKTYTYTTNTTDPNNDQIYYRWDWGDGNYSIWLGPYNSGQIASASHVWMNGNYSIKVKAKDVPGLESGWSDPLTIYISVNFKPILTNASPANNSINMSRPPMEFNISVEDPNGDSMDVYFCWRNHSNDWVTLMVHSEVNNGTYNFIPSYENDWIWGDTLYTWSVNVTDGTNWTNETYTYTTGGSRYDVNNNNKVNFQDAGLVWVHRTSLVTYDGLYDVNQDGNVNFQDAGLTWVNRAPPQIAIGDCADVNYIGRYTSNNTIFDTSGGTPLKIFVSFDANATSPKTGYTQSMIKGFIEGLIGMREGQTKIIGSIPPEKAYGIKLTIGSIFTTQYTAFGMNQTVEVTKYDGENLSLKWINMENLSNFTMPQLIINNLQSSNETEMVIYPPPYYIWENSTSIINITDTTVTVSTTPTKSTNFSNIVPYGEKQMLIFPNVTIASWNDTTITVVCSPLIGQNYTFQTKGYTGMINVTVSINNISGDKINVTITNDQSSEPTYLDLYRTFSFNRSYVLPRLYKDIPSMYISYFYRQDIEKAGYSLEPLAGESLTFEATIEKIYKTIK